SSEAGRDRRKWRSRRMRSRTLRSRPRCRARPGRSLYWPSPPGLSRSGSSLRGDRLSLRVEDPPEVAEAVDSLPGRVAGGLVLLEVVQGMSGVCDLDRAVGARGGAEKRGVDPGARLRLAGREHGRPEHRALRVASGLGASVLDEQVHGHALLVDQDLAVLGVVGDGDLHAGSGFARGRAGRCRRRARSTTGRKLQRQDGKGSGEERSWLHAPDTWLGYTAPAGARAESSATRGSPKVIVGATGTTRPLTLTSLHPPSWAMR